MTDNTDTPTVSPEPQRPPILVGYLDMGPRWHPDFLRKCREHNLHRIEHMAQNGYLVRRDDLGRPIEWEYDEQHAVASLNDRVAQGWNGWINVDIEQWGPIRHPTEYSPEVVEYAYNLFRNAVLLTRQLRPRAKLLAHQMPLRESFYEFAILAHHDGSSLVPWWREDRPDLNWEFTAKHLSRSLESTRHLPNFTRWIQIGRHFQRQPGRPAMSTAQLEATVQHLLSLQPDGVYLADFADWATWELDATEQQRDLEWLDMVLELTRL